MNKWLLVLNISFLLAIQILAQKSWQPLLQLYNNAWIRGSAINSQNEILIQVYHKGFFLSTDYGETWVDLHQQLPTEMTSFNAQDSKVCVGTHEHYGNGETGLFLSLDFGRSWTKISNGNDLENSYIAATTFLNNSTILVGTKSKGIIKYDMNNSQTSFINNGLELLYVDKFIITNNNKLFCATYDDDTHKSQLYLFNYFEDTWNKLDFIDERILSISTFGDDNLIISTFNGVFVSFTEGINWINRNNGLGYDEVRAMVINNENEIYAGTFHGLFFSSDTAKTWNKVYGEGDFWIQNLLLSNDYIFLSPSGKGFYRIDYNFNNSTRVFNEGPRFVNNRAILSDINGVYVGSEIRGIYFSDNLIDWEYIGFESDDFNIRSIVSDQEGNVFVNNSSIYGTIDGGRTWIEKFSSLLNFTSLKMTNSNKIYVGDSDCDLYSSTNSGTSWQFVHNFSSMSGYCWKSINDIIEDDLGEIFVAVDVNCQDWGGTYGVEFLSRSSNNISTYTNVLDNTLVISLGKVGNNVVLAGLEDGIISSTDNGFTWRESNLPATKVNCIKAYDEVTVYAGTDDGVFYSTDMGLTWIAISNAGLESTIINDFDFYNNNEILAATPLGTFIYSDSIYTNVGEPNDKNLESFLLMDNYPNPFNAQTNISFNLLYDSNIKLEIFNTLGESIIVLADGKFRSGKHVLTFDASSVNRGISSGIYLYRLSINGDQQMNKKMILLK